MSKSLRRKSHIIVMLSGLLLLPMVAFQNCSGSLGRPSEDQSIQSGLSDDGRGFPGGKLDLVQVQLFDENPLVTGARYSYWSRDYQCLDSNGDYVSSPNGIYEFNGHDFDYYEDLCDQTSEPADPDVFVNLNPKYNLAFSYFEGLIYSRKLQSESQSEVYSWAHCRFQIGHREAGSGVDFVFYRHKGQDYSTIWAGVDIDGAPWVLKSKQVKAKIAVSTDEAIFETEYFTVKLDRTKAGGFSFEGLAQNVWVKGLLSTYSLRCNFEDLTDQ